MALRMPSWALCLRDNGAECACEPRARPMRDAELPGRRIGYRLNTLTIEGVAAAAASSQSVPHMEIGSYIALAALTGGELLIQNAAPRISACRFAFDRLGCASRRAR